jgi:hypothetical protein
MANMVRHREMKARWLGLMGFAVAAVVMVGRMPAVWAAPAADAGRTPRALKVFGTQILDNQNQPVRLRGVNVASLEWTSTGEHILKSVNTAIQDWHVNILRLPLAQDRWFGKAREQSDGGVAYRRSLRAGITHPRRTSAYS